MKRPKSYDILEADQDIYIKGGWCCRKKGLQYNFTVLGKIKRYDSAGFRTNETLCQLSYEAPYLGLTEWGRSGRPTQAVKHTCSGNLGIVKI